MASILERLDAVVHYAIAVHPDRTVHRHVLQSILWLADIAHYKSYFVPVTWAQQHSPIDGIPTAEGLNHALDRLTADGRVQKMRRIFTRSPGIHYQSNDTPNVRHVSARSLHTVRAATHALRQCTAHQARHSSFNRVGCSRFRRRQISLQAAAELSSIDALAVGGEIRTRTTAVCATVRSCAATENGGELVDLAEPEFKSMTSSLKSSHRMRLPSSRISHLGAGQSVYRCGTCSERRYSLCGPEGTAPNLCSDIAIEWCGTADF